MEDAPENGKESPHSVHASGLIDGSCLMLAVSRLTISGN